MKIKQRAEIKETTASDLLQTRKRWPRTGACMHEHTHACMHAQGLDTPRSQHTPARWKDSSTLAESQQYHETSRRNGRDVEMQLTGYVPFSARFSTFSLAASTMHRLHPLLPCALLFSLALPLPWDLFNYFSPLPAVMSLPACGCPCVGCLPDGWTEGCFYQEA